MNNEIDILKNIFGEKDYNTINEKLDILNYILTITFDEIRILKFVDNNSDITYVVYVNNLDIPYKLNSFDKSFFINLKKIYYDKPLNYSNKLKRFSGILSKINMTKENLEKIIVKNKYLDMYYWGSYFENYPFEDIYEKKYSRYQINKMNIYALRQYDEDDIFEINILTKYSKSKVTFRFYENAFFIEINYNSFDNSELEKFYKSTQILPSNLPVDLYLAIQQFHLLDYLNIFELKPVSVNHFKYSSFLLNNNDTTEIENYFKFLNNLNIISEDLISYKDELINLLTLNNLVKHINSEDIINILNEDSTYETKKQKIRKYLFDFFENNNENNNIFFNRLVKIRENFRDFLELHINNLSEKFISN